MKNAIFMSIKETHINKILNKSKNHEFRNKIPKKKVNYIIVYIPSPIKKLKYVIEVEKVVVRPNKIKNDGIGNIEFNNQTKAKYAYPIKSVYEINADISLTELRVKFDFTAPQSFAYGEKYKKLLEHINQIGMTKIY